MRTRTLLQQGIPCSFSSTLFTLQTATTTLLLAQPPMMKISALTSQRGGLAWSTRAMLLVCRHTLCRPKKANQQVAEQSVREKR